MSDLDERKEECLLTALDYNVAASMPTKSELKDLANCFEELVADHDRLQKQLARAKQAIIDLSETREGQSAHDVATEALKDIEGIK